MKNADKPASESTLREHFAGLVMQGLVSEGVNGIPSSDDAARIAVVYADALLASLEDNCD